MDHPENGLLAQDARLGYFSLSHCCDDSRPMRRRFLDCQGNVGGGALRRLVRTERASRGSALGEGCLAGCFGEGKDAEGGVEVVVVGGRPIGVLRGTDLGEGELG